MSKHKIMIIVNPEIASGFKLAGVQVEVANSVEEAEEILKKILLTGHEYGVIGIDGSLNEELNPALLEKIEDRGFPILVPFRTEEIYKWEKVDIADDYTAKLIRNAIGYDIKI